MAEQKTQLDQLAAVTTVVADTGEIEQIRTFRPTDATTNPSLIFKAVQKEEYQPLLPKAIEYAKANATGREEILALAIDRLAVEFGIEILKIVPGVVSSELDARLSYDIEASVTRAVRIIQMYADAGIEKERVLIKVASTWEGLQVSKILREEHGIRTNMTLLFNMWQAAAAGEVGSFLISPFCGRITDYFKKAQGVDSFPPEEDPGVLSVRSIFKYYKKFGFETIVMGASFRSADQVRALSGCDRLTIGPKWLQELRDSTDPLPTILTPESGAESEFAERFNVNEANFRWGMCQDPMATEKLAEGIRKFAADLEKLEGMIAEQL